MNLQAMLMSLGNVIDALDTGLYRDVDGETWRRARTPEPSERANANLEYWIRVKGLERVGNAMAQLQVELAWLQRHLVTDDYASEARLTAAADALMDACHDWHDPNGARVLSARSDFALLSPSWHLGTIYLTIRLSMA